MSANSHPPAILPETAANSNKPGDLAAAPRKSPRQAILQIPSPPPTLEERLVRANKTIRCHHVKTNGTRCGSPSLRDDIYCYFHRNWRTQPDCQPVRPDPNAIVWELPVLEDADGVQMALQLILNSVLANKMDLKRASILLYGLQTAACNVRRTQFAYRSDISTELK